MDLNLTIVMTSTSYRARTGSGSGQGLSDSEHLHDVFLAAIKDLKLMHERQTNKCKELEEKVIMYPRLG